MVKNRLPLVAIIGPTASGKSSLAVRLARRFGGTIISADSRQVYRGMDIGTGKITKREMAGVQHELLDVAGPRRQFTVVDFQKHVARVMKMAEPPFWLVGGSPLYVDAVLYPEQFPSVKPDPKFRKRLAGWSTLRLIRALNRRDPFRAKNIDPKNRRRLIRALEIIHSTGKPVPKRTQAKTDALILGITLPRAKLYQNIDQRLDARLRRGLIAEVRRLHEQGVTWKRLESFGLEYKYVALFLQNRLAKPEMVDRLKGAIHAFARRQLTWWKRNRDIRWIATYRGAENVVRAWLKRKAAAGTHRLPPRQELRHR